MLKDFKEQTQNVYTELDYNSVKMYEVREKFWEKIGGVLWSLHGPPALIG